MALQGEPLTIDHGPPKQVNLDDIQAELESLTREAMGKDGNRTFGRMLTLVVYADGDEDWNELQDRVGEIIVRVSGRAILIRRTPEANDGELQAFVSTHCLIRGDQTLTLCGELVTLHTSDGDIDELRNLVLSLRLRDLPLVLWWRAPVRPQDPLFLSLVRACDQVILDSCRFATRVDELGELVSFLARQSGRVSFGDINWARLIPWRELIAQFFDTPEHLIYLDRLDELELDYSARNNGNPSQALLITMWLATLLRWDVARGSWEANGHDRSLKLLNQGREIRVHIKGEVETDAPPGWLSGVTLRATGEPSADFQVNWCGENCVTTFVKIGRRVVERSLALSVPDEVTLVCEEFDASRQDRVYHQALYVLEQVVRS